MFPNRQNENSQIILIGHYPKCGHKTVMNYQIHGNSYVANGNVENIHELIFASNIPTGTNDSITSIKV